jgi:hypothetical protein
MRRSDGRRYRRSTRETTLHSLHTRPARANRSLLLVHVSAEGRRGDVRLVGGDVLRSGVRAPGKAQGCSPSSRNLRPKGR